MASEQLLYHFSEDPAISEFVPRAVEGSRPPGREWLNTPLVWAIDEWHSPCYLFPRDCPRILWWPLPRTTPADRERYIPAAGTRVVACIERAWLERLNNTTLYRYQFPGDHFTPLEDHGVHVSRETVRPAAVDRVPALPEALHQANVELRVMPDLTPLRGMWDTTLHVSGIRLRNATGWA
jgi:hypothetical protein